MAALQQEKVEQVRQFIAEAGRQPHSDSQLIAVMHRVQGLFGYLPREMMDLVAESMNMPTAHIWGVATFYHYFNLQPPGRHTISVCLGTACYVKGANEVLEAVKTELGVKVGETTSDGLFTLREARCLGACGIAPVMMIDEKIYGELTPRSVAEILARYRKATKETAA